jgi:hypothetical protein
MLRVVADIYRTQHEPEEAACEMQDFQKLKDQKK